MPELSASFRLLDHVFPMMGAFFLALPIAWDREAHARGPGLRTFPLVAMASCGFLLLAGEMSQDPSAGARVLAGLITGIGFIGGGAILKKGGMVAGLATATSIWITGAIGASMAVASYDIALCLSLLTFAILRWSQPVKQVVSDSSPDSED